MNNDGTVKEPTKILRRGKNGESHQIKKSPSIVEQAGARLLRSLSRSKKAGKMSNCSMAAGMTGIKHTKKDPSKYPVQVGDPRDEDKVKILN